MPITSLWVLAPLTQPTTPSVSHLVEKKDDCKLPPGYKQTKGFLALQLIDWYTKCVHHRKTVSIHYKDWPMSQLSILRKGTLVTKALMPLPRPGALSLAWSIVTHQCWGPDRSSKKDCIKGLNPERWLQGFFSPDTYVSLWDSKQPM